MLWLIVGIILLIVAIAGGAIVHPILFALAIVALVMFFAGSRGRVWALRGAYVPRRHAAVPGSRGCSRCM